MELISRPPFSGKRLRAASIPTALIKSFAAAIPHFLPRQGLERLQDTATSDGTLQRKRHSTDSFTGDALLMFIAPKDKTSLSQVVSGL
ncbi:MAG: hypothetical protein NTW75_01275 [Planctomycetales bacterium]|nr:hypothetical protein [Planctomycetales bacterium]